MFATVPADGGIAGALQSLSLEGEGGPRGAVGVVCRVWCCQLVAAGPSTVMPTPLEQWKVLKKAAAARA